MSVFRALTTCGVLTVALMAGGCASSGDLDGVYTKVETAGAAKAGSISSILTIEGDNCSFHHAAEPDGVEHDEACTVEGEHLVFSEGDGRAEVSLTRTGDGDLRIGLGDGDLYRKTGEA